MEKELSNLIFSYAKSKPFVVLASPHCIVRQFFDELFFLADVPIVENSTQNKKS
jgi:hypothetical protein